MAEHVVGFVLERLQKLLIDEARLLSGVRDKVEQLRVELERMRCFLKDADARQDEDEMIRFWVAQIRELALDTEDALERYAFKIPQKQDNSVLGHLFGIFKEIPALHQVGSEILRFKGKISELSTVMERYGIRSTSQGEKSRYSGVNRSYQHVVEHDFVGLEDDVENLVARLVNEDGANCPRVVAIYGMGGLGKSTIAKKVFHHDDIRQRFQAFSWSSISHQWQARDILEGIITKLSPEKREEVASLKEDELIEELHNIQKMKKCLLVLDDIWSKDFWDCLRAAFPLADSGSKIILTTRIREVAMHVDPACLTYEPRFLNAKESWELLRKKALPRQATEAFINADMEEVGRNMAEQCGGLPLAIIVLGGLLLARTELNNWEEVYRNLNLYRRSRSRGQYGTVNRVLALSYHDLPYHLKPCFLHLGNFPEDSKIPARKLIQLWAAEGFVPLESHQEGEETMIDIGERYLGELAQRCMIQLQIDYSTGRFKYCHLHDLMRDVCLSKAKEEKFLRVISQRDDREPGVSSSSTGAEVNGAIRRISVTVRENFETYFPPEGEKIEQVRSSIFFSRLAGRKPLPPSLILTCLQFHLLRVLEMERFNFGRKMPKGIGNLVCLRYMSFRGSQFEKLPSSLCNLTYLQTLDLRVAFTYLAVPDVIKKLQHLRHLYLPDGNVNNLQLRSLSKLETLKNFDTRVSDFRDLLHLTKLQKISAVLDLQLDDLGRIVHYLTGNSNRLRDSSFRIHYHFRSENELTLLRQLLGCHHLRKLDLIGEIGDLPHYSNFSSSLTSLTLRRSGLEEDIMPILEKLPGLRTLSLRANAFVGKKMRFSAQGFPQLRTLGLEGLLKLKKLKVEEGAMPNLTHLEIDGCAKLKMVPVGFRFLSTIQELRIVNMPDGFKRRLKVFNEREGEDFNKVQHISSIIIYDTSNDSRKLLERQLPGNRFSGLLQTITPSSVPMKWRTL